MVMKKTHCNQVMNQSTIQFKTIGTVRTLQWIV